MLDSASLTAFKKFQNLELPLRPLTVLTGVNSGGKSSFLQSFLLARSPLTPSGAARLNGGPYRLALGEAADVLNWEADEQRISLVFASGSSVAEFIYDVPTDRSSTLRVVKAANPDGLVAFGEGERVFTYLSAERLGPRDVQDVASEAEGDMNVGPRGEFTGHVLSQFDRTIVPPGLVHPDTEERGGSPALGAQAEAWLSAIVRPIQIQSVWLQNAGAVAVRFKPPNVITEWLKPSNVGFGLTYALPVIVASLTATAGGLLVVENPEAHLHPAGQSRIGRFLGRVAATGVQVLVETHSDHFVNGLRRAVAEEQSIRSEHMIVYYFSDGRPPAAIEPDENGALSGWPDGFFDQLEIDLGALAHVRDP
jgi:predicted ATPase